MCDFDLEKFEDDLHYHWKGNTSREDLENFLLDELVEDITGKFAAQDMSRQMRRTEGTLYIDYYLDSKKHIASWSKGKGWIFKFNRNGIVNKMISVADLEKGDQFPTF